MATKVIEPYVRKDATLANPALLRYNAFYHIFNCGAYDENIFFEDWNYAHFLDLHEKHIKPIADTYAFCLLSNHFHMFVRIKSQRQTQKVFKEDYHKRKMNNSVNDVEKQADESSERANERLHYPSKKFSNFYNAYAKSINAAYGRSGSLFQHPFRRVLIPPDTQLVRVITFIHQNPQKHGYVDDFRDWDYSSYNEILSKNPTFLERDTVLKWFGNKPKYYAMHNIWVTEAKRKVFCEHDFA